MNQVKRAVIFDLDGTLVNSLPDMAKAVNHVLAACGRPELDDTQVEHMVGNGAKVLLERAFAACGGIPDDGLPPHLAEFHRYYQAHPVVHTTIFPGVTDTLATLKNAGLVLAVCTNKSSASTREVLKGLNLDQYFAVVVGGDDTPALKPDPVHINTVLNRLGLAADQTVMVGDSINDALAAREAGVPCILVSFGYTKTSPHEMGAQLVIDDFRHLVPAILGR